MDKAEILKIACQYIANGDVASAGSCIVERYPFIPIQTSSRNYTAIIATRVFTRDGFIDRYSGERLIFPGALRLLSLLLPAEFPYHTNWKMTETHPAFWSLYATVDHVEPIARGGSDSLDNLVTTSMLMNSAKSNWLLDELKWALRPIEKTGNWDGLLSFFLNQLNIAPELKAHKHIQRWHSAAKACGAA